MSDFLERHRNNQLVVIRTADDDGSSDLHTSNGHLTAVGRDCCTAALTPATYPSRVRRGNNFDDERCRIRRAAGGSDTGSTRDSLFGV